MTVGSANTRTAERLVATIDWSRLRASDGNGDGVRDAIVRLLAADSGEAAQRAYWGIENHAFAQGELFEVAEASSAVLVAVLVDQREGWVRSYVLELLFQILSGYPSSAPSTPIDLVERCRQAVGEGLWLLVREAHMGHRDAALDVLDALGEGAEARRVLEGGDQRADDHNSRIRTREDAKEWDE